MRFNNIVLSFIFLFSIFISTSSSAYPLIPKVQGAYCTLAHHDFDEMRYGGRVIHCKRGVSRSLKAKIYRDYGIPVSQKGNYTVDHIIPLSLGGDNSYDNLWPQHKSIHTGKIEYQMYLLVKDSNYDAQTAIDNLLLKKFNPEMSWDEIF